MKFSCNCLFSDDFLKCHNRKLPHLIIWPGDMRKKCGITEHSSDAEEKSAQTYYLSDAKLCFKALYLNFESDADATIIRELRYKRFLCKFKE